MIKQSVYEIVFFFVKVADYVIPKNKKKVIIYSYPDYSDNCRAMYEYMINHDVVKKYNITWVVNNVKKYKDIIPYAKVVKHKSLGSLWHFIRAKYIIRTHSFWNNIYVPGRQIMCVAWHGVPIKGYHYTEMGTYPHNCHDHFCIPSPLFQKMYSELMDTDMDRFDVVGFPRNDFLFSDASDLLGKLHLDSFDKRIIWMPTFRGYASGVDGKASDFGLPTFHKGDLERVNEVLKQKNYCLILKLHPWAMDSLGEIDFSNIVEIKDAEIPSEYSLYHLLGQMDAMVSDYSSVWVDYLLLDRPIAFAFDDLEEYLKKRYMPLSPIESYMPGMRTRNASEFIMFIQSLEQEDLYVEKRKEISSQFLSYRDGCNSERFLKAIGLI